MKEILEKLTTYNLFNYLLPGVLFVVSLDMLTSYSLIQKDLILGAFVYYFAGLVISRFGSLVVEPILKKMSFLKFANYADFVSASKQDSKIETLSEANNMYRTFTAMLVLLLLLKTYDLVAIKLPILNEYGFGTLVILLLVMFLFSYRKQTAYIVKRINSANIQL